jgi:hypothetical protein
VTTAPHPAARGLLVWMQAHPGRLRELLDREARGEDDLAPAGDPAVRAHLIFVAEALAATAAPGAAGGLEGFAARLPRTLREREADVDAAMRTVGEAHAFEVDLQFGAEAREDPAMRAMLERRVRVAAWTRVFLDALAHPRQGPRGDRLADTIFAMDRRAKQGEIERGGPDAVASPEVVNRIGQAAMLQAHSRFLVEALAETL